MPIDNSGRLLFIHIPRTSGTMFEKNILEINGKWPQPLPENLWGFGTLDKGGNKKFVM